MIKAGCPQWICKKCGKARERISKYDYEQHGEIKEYEKAKNPMQCNKFSTRRLGRASIKDVTTIGWTDCGCNAGWDSGIVLDPFAGSGTTCLVAKKLGRHYIGIELNPEYVKMAKKRLAKIPERLESFAEIW